MPVKTVEALAPWAVGIVLAAPALVAFYPPMTDLAFHEAAIGILRHFDDASMFPRGLYVHNLGEPNQLFHMVGWALSYVVSTRWAVKIVVAATIVALPVCAARFARHCGASPLAALAVAPMALGWLFSWGLITNLIGLAALLAVLPVLDDYAARPTRRRAAAAFGAIVLLFFAHEAMLFVYGLMALLLAAMCPWSRSGTAARLGPLAAIVAVHTAHVRWANRFLTPAVRGMPVFWHPLWHKVKRVPYILFPAHDGVVQAAMLALCIFAVGSFFWLRARERRSSRPLTAPPAADVELRMDRLQRWAYAHRFECFAAACASAYFIMPLTLHGATLVYQRFFPPAYAVLAVVAAPSDLSTRAARPTRWGLFALAAATLLVAWPSFADSDRQYRALERIVNLVEPGSAVADLNLGPGNSDRRYSLGPAAGRILAERGGRLSYAFTDSPISPVVIPRRYQWNDSLIRLGFDSWSFRPDLDLTRFRYVLVRTTDPALAWLVTFALARQAEYVAESGEWLLLRSTLPVVPLLSPGVRLPAPPPPSIRDAIQRAAGELGGSRLVPLPAASASPTDDAEPSRL